MVRRPVDLIDPNAKLVLNLLAPKDERRDLYSERKHRGNTGDNFA